MVHRARALQSKRARHCRRIEVSPPLLKPQDRAFLRSDPQTPQFPELACLGRPPSGTVLDGELVVLQVGQPSLRQPSAGRCCNTASASGSRAGPGP
jgi:hypothetical protein